MESVSLARSRGRGRSSPHPACERCRRRCCATTHKPPASPVPGRWRRR
ncbi:hypothetical protein [Lysobacter gummosus]